MHPPFSIIFCGTPEFAIPCLNALIASEAFDVKLVITQPDRPVGRKQTLTPPPVKVLAQEHDIAIAQPENINATDIAQVPCDFLITVAYGQIIKKHLLQLPSIAPVNVHPSLLPRWRGAAPIQNALLSGDTSTGVTIQRMTEELDAGDILGQEQQAIALGETAETLHDKLSALAASLLVKTLGNPLHPQPQESGSATFCKKLSRKDGMVNLATMTAEEIDRHVRALVPWPGVTCVIGREEVKIHRTSLEPSDNSLPLRCKDGTTLFVMEMQSPGKTILRGDEWARRNSMS